jgi:hypothetical protein
VKRWMTAATLVCAFITATLCRTRAASAPVQEAVGIAAPASSFILAFPANVIQGDQVTIFAACAGHSNQLAVSGLGGAVWNLVENNPLPLDPDSPADALWQTAAPAGAGNSITVTATSADECAAYAAEWSGTSGVKDTGAANDRNSNWFGDLGNAPTINANDLVIMGVAWKGSATITGAPIGSTGPLRAYTAMAPVNAEGVLSIQPYYFLAWRSGSFPAVNGSFDSACDWSTLQVALKSASANPSPTAAPPCAGPTPPGAVMPRPCTGWGASQW